MICTIVKIFQTSSRDKNRNLHYDSVKKYFREDECTTTGYRQTTRNIPKQQKIFDLTMSILEGFIGNHSELTKALDAGCGAGSFTLELSQRFPQLKQIVGTDFLRETITDPIKKIKHNKKISFIQSDLLNIPFDDKTFDVTICLDVLHHIYRDDFQNAIKELARVTDQYLLIEIRNKKNIFNLWYRHVIQPLFYRNLPVHTTSIDEVNNLIKDHQFQLKLAKRIASSRFSCRRLVLVYERN